MELGGLESDELDGIKKANCLRGGELEGVKSMFWVGGGDEGSIVVACEGVGE